MVRKALFLLAAWLPAGALAQPQAPQPELGCAFDALAPAQRSAIARDYSVYTVEAGKRVAAALTPLLDACSARYRWDDARRRWAGDYAGQRAELEARAAALPAIAPAERLRAIVDAMPEADRAGMAAGAQVSDSEYRAIGLRLRERFDAAAIPRPAQAQAAGYVLALAHLREIEASWAALPTR